jgi:predicted RNase H-like HicB family nuclease
MKAMDAILTATYVQDGKWIVAWFDELPGVMTQGKTVEEARANLRDALEQTILARRDLAEREAKSQTVVLREALQVHV